MSAVLTTDDHMSMMAPLADKTGAKVFRIAESAQEDSHAAQACSDAAHSAYMRLSPDPGLKIIISPLCYKGRSGLGAVAK